MRDFQHWTVALDPPSSGSEPVVEKILPSCYRSLHLTQKHSLPSIFLSGERQCTYGCGGFRATTAKRIALRVSSMYQQSDRTNTKIRKRMRSLSHTDRPKLAREIVADGDNPAPV